MAKSSKRSHSKGNSLPLTKQFDFIMVDDDFEELLRSSPIKKQTQTQRNACSSSNTGPAQGTITAAQPLKWCLITFSSLTPCCNSLKSSSTMVLSNRLAGGWLLPLLRERLEDYPRIFRAALFGKPLTTRFQWRIAYFTALALGRFVPSGLVQ